MQSITVNGWNLVKVEGSEERRILDVELGERLGYAKPLRAVQRIIEELIKDGEMAGVLRGDRTVLTQMPTGGTREDTVKAYYLTEREVGQRTVLSPVPMYGEWATVTTTVTVAVVDLNSISGDTDHPWAASPTPSHLS